MRELVGPILAEIRDGLQTVLEPTPALVFVAPGALVAWDDCCGGQAWSRLVSILPVYPANGPAGCAALYWNIIIEVGVLRCAATVDSQGRAPTGEELSADAEQMLADEVAVWGLLTCELGASMGDVTWTPQGPEGGCVGGVWAFTMKIDACRC